MEKHPYDNWPPATYEGEWLPENGQEPPRPEEEIANDLNQKDDVHWGARSKYNPFSVGGSESIHDFEKGEN
tara:strand:- start:46 stop:258 length:213 start_codon:yes stop_codon:yes gene_type:complete